MGVYVITEEEKEQKIKEWLEKEFKPEEAKKLERYIETLKDKLKILKRKRIIASLKGIIVYVVLYFGMVVVPFYYLGNIFK